MLGNRELQFGDFVAMARRRIWWIIIPTVLVPILAFVGSLFVPDRYTSQTLVLVEQQKVPDNFVKPVVSEELQERLVTMQEQILSRTRLQPIIESLGLYKNEVGKTATEDLIDRMRQNIKVTAVKADFAANSRTAGLPGFYITFTSDNPRTAQQVCAKITEMFVNENLRAREQSAQGTTEFLAGQLAEAKLKLDDQNAKLAAFKQRNINQLPGQEQQNLTILSSLNNRMDALNQAIAAAQQQKDNLDNLLAQQVRQWKATQLSMAGSSEDLQKRRDLMQADLISLQARYTDDHPDVIKLKSQIAELDKKIEQVNSLGKDKEQDAKITASEPTEILKLRLSLKNTEDIIKQKNKERSDLEKNIRAYQARIQTSPAIEEEYKQLTLGLQSAQAFYDELLNKKRQSEMATDLERRQQAEQFRVIDPPNLPESPTFPNRLLISFGGLGAGFFLGGGLAIALELRDQSMRNEQDVLACLNLPTLVSVPLITDEPSQGRKIWKKSKKEKELVGA